MDDIIKENAEFVEMCSQNSKQIRFLEQQQLLIQQISLQVRTVIVSHPYSAVGSGGDSLLQRAGIMCDLLHLHPAAEGFTLVRLRDATHE